MVVILRIVSILLCFSVIILNKSICTVKTKKLLPQESVVLVCIPGDPDGVCLPLSFVRAVGATVPCPGGIPIRHFGTEECWAGRFSVGMWQCCVWEEGLAAVAHAAHFRSAGHSDGLALHTAIHTAERFW